MEFIDLKRQYQLYKNEINRRITAVMENASFIMGAELKELENKLANYVGTKHAIGCASGTDALLLGLLAYDIKEGDEIITTPFTFVATAEVVAFIKAKPVFVDIDERTYNIDARQIEKKITSRTKGIIPVSLYGQVADMDEINAIAKKYNLFVIEDGCQSFGAVYKGRKSCGLSDIGTTSFFPSKPLGCYGDGGMVFTNSDELARKIRSFLNHGQVERYVHHYIGLNMRLDNIQAAVLLEKFVHLEEELNLRHKIGLKYNELLKDVVITPYIADYTDRCVFAQYSIRVKNRDEFAKKLSGMGIPTAVHYPLPLHLQVAYKYLGYKEGDFPVSEAVSKEIISLPMHPFLTDEDIERIVSCVKKSLV
ncbi:MAG: DegT/DnrJ/EryC1/StrS family aminotransferase [Brevinematia bacterium]